MKFMKRLLVTGFCATLVMSSVNSVYAEDSIATLYSNTEDIQLENLGENTIGIQSSDEQGVVSVTENETERIITIIDSDTGTTNYIKYDKSANTVYSSLTGETIDLTTEKEYQPDTASPSTRSVTSYETKKISYAQIKRIVGNVATAASVIGAILYFVPSAQSIGGALTEVGTIVDFLKSGIPASSSHGIKLKIKVTKYYRGTSKNKHVYKTIRFIVGGSIY